jgi:regulatory protein YycI of two-component signal transduction system YycFG
MTKNPVTPEDFKNYFNAHLNVVPTNDRIPLLSYWNDIDWLEEDRNDLVDRWDSVYGEEINGLSLVMGDNANPLLACLKIGSNDLEIIERIHREFPSKVVMTDGTHQYLFYVRCSSETKHRYSFACPFNMGTIEVLYYDCLVPMPPTYLGAWKTFKWADEGLSTLINTPVKELTVLDHKKVLNIGKLINSPTVDALNIDLPNEEKFNGKLNRKDSIDAFLGKIYRKNPHNSIEDTVTQVLDFDLNNYPNASFFLGVDYKSINRESNALLYVAKFNQEYLLENGIGATFSNKIEDDKISFNELVPVTKAHSKITSDELPVFSDEHIPELWKKMVSDVSEGQGTPPQGLFMTMFAALGACMQGNTLIRPDPKDKFIRRTNIPLTLVAPSGSKKSDVIRIATAEVAKISDLLYSSNTREDLTRVLDNESKIEMIEREKKKPGADLEALNIEKFKIQDELAAQPLKGTKFIYGNATVQKMINDAKKNQKHGLLMIKDEMKQIFADMKKKGNEDYRSFYMEGFDGNGSPYRYSTMSRDEDKIDKHVLSLITSVQDDVVSTYINELYGAYGSNDGFLQRIIMVPFGKRIVKRAKKVDFSKFVHAYEIFNTAFYHDDMEINIDPACWELYTDMKFDIDLRAASYENNSPLCSVLSKHLGFLCSFAAVYELLHTGKPPTKIGERALRSAFALLEYLAECAKHLFKVKDKQEDQDAVIGVAKQLCMRHFRDGGTQSDWHQSVRFLYKNPTTFYNALQELEIRGYVCLKDNRKGSVSCWINPMVHML